MDELAVGDVVRSDAFGGFSKVFTFAHSSGDKTAFTDYVHFELATGDKIELTAEHMLYVLGKGSAVSGMRMASNVQVDDELLHMADGPQRVVAIKTVSKKGGIFAPFTRKGSIVVNNILASSYAGVDHCDLKLGGHTIASAQTVSNLALMPLVALHAVLPASAAHAAIEGYGIRASSPGSLNNNTVPMHPYVYYLKLGFETIEPWILNPLKTAPPPALLRMFALLLCVLIQLAVSQLA